MRTTTMNPVNPSPQDSPTPHISTLVWPAIAALFLAVTLLSCAQSAIEEPAASSGTFLQ